MISKKFYLCGHLTYALWQNFPSYNIKCRASHGMIGSNDLSKRTTTFVSVIVRFHFIYKNGYVLPCHLRTLYNEKYERNKTIKKFFSLLHVKNIWNIEASNLFYSLSYNNNALTLWYASFNFITRENDKHGWFFRIK